ncbi:ATP-binding protein [Nonlabens sp.]|uniref:AAA family ATPase n=1 Tax=Nonlabens sp. TaxID=1888209 RepID=UPI001BCECFB7|nr:ATP-binding protein [Nonlabens sp.]
MEKIPQQRAFIGIKIVLYGPESTGKSTLACELTDHFKTIKVDEYARPYLQEKLDRTGKVCDYEDLVPIAVGQRKAENHALTTAKGYLFCDTDVLETYVYSLAYFDKAPAVLEKAVRKSDYDLYLLLDIDIPWVADGLRDRPKDRKEMFGRFEKGLLDFQKNYSIISGTGEERFKNALNAIKKLEDK